MKLLSIRNLLIISALLHLCAAIFSEGYYHVDEHCQVLELVSYRFFHSPARELTWEFPAELRAWAQPFFYGSVAWGLRGLGIDSPFVWAAAFRLLTGAFAFYVTWRIFVMLRAQWKPSAVRERWLAAGLFLTGFVPYLHVRPSSETLSSALFWLAFALLETPGLSLTGARAFGSGLLAGFAFVTRFPAALLVGGHLASLLARRKFSLTQTALYISGGLLALGIGAGLDAWGYGHASFPAWNYFRTNLVENKSHEFGVAPWWEYFRLALLELPPIGALLLVGTLLFWWRRPRDPLTWATLPFWAIHLGIAHKELRFLFPIVFVAPALAIEGFASLPSFRPRAWRKPLPGLLLGLLLAGNGAVLLFLTFLPAKAGAPLLRGLYGAHPPVTHYLYEREDPYPLLGLRMNFYHPQGMTGVDAGGNWPAAFAAELARERPENQRYVDVLVPGVDLPESLARLSPHCVQGYSSLPAWLFDAYRRGRIRYPVRTHYRCDGFSSASNA
jgi:phosphatidylinositol glycan class B